MAESLITRYTTSKIFGRIFTKETRTIFTTLRERECLTSLKIWPKIGPIISKFLPRRGKVKATPLKLLTRVQVEVSKEGFEASWNWLNFIALVLFLPSIMLHFLSTFLQISYFRPYLDSYFLLHIKPFQNIALCLFRYFSPDVPHENGIFLLL